MAWQLEQIKTIDVSLHKLPLCLLLLKSFALVELLPINHPRIVRVEILQDDESYPTSRSEGYSTGRSGNCTMRQRPSEGGQLPNVGVCETPSLKRELSGETSFRRDLWKRYAAPLFVVV